MTKYARVKEDGYIMNFSIHMDDKKFDFFESDEPPPEFVSDLPAYLSGSKDEKVTAKPKKAKPDPVFLRTADGAIAAT